MSDSQDQVRRALGAKANIALEAVGVAIWKRSDEIVTTAMNLLNSGELTSERSHSLMISLIEQRNIAENLKSQVSDGAKAVQRMNDAVDRAAAAKADAEHAERFGRNRFTQSKVPESNSTVDR